MKGLAMLQGKSKKKKCCTVSPEDERQAWDAVLEMYHNSMSVTSHERKAVFKNALTTLLPEYMKSEVY